MHEKVLQFYSNIEKDILKIKRETNLVKFMSRLYYAYILKHIMLYLLNEVDILTLPYKKILKKIKPNLCRHSDHVENQTNICLKCFYKNILMPNFPATSITVV